MKSGPFGYAGAAERHHRLRYVELDDDPTSQPLRRDGIDLCELGLCRQRAEYAVEDGLERSASISPTTAIFRLSRDSTRRV